MLKLNNTKQQSFTTFKASQPNLEVGRRFIVPVINPEDDFTFITRRVWELANVTGSRVQFLGLCDDAINEPTLRRTLATVSAMMNYGNVSADWTILLGKNWLENLRSHVQVDDTVICWNELYSKLLQVNLGVPVFVISEKTSRKRSHSSWSTQVAAWAGSIAIIVFFFFLQVQVDHLAKNWVTLMQVLSVMGEFWLIWVWNNLFK